MELDLYTDCSWSSTSRRGQGACKSYGIGLLITNYEDIELQCSIKLRNGCIINDIQMDVKPDINIGELYSIYKGILALPKGTSKVNIYTDSEYSFLILNEACRLKEKYKAIKKIKDRINQVVSERNIKLNVMWIKGHVKTWGNDIVDRLAKCAKSSNQTKNIIVVNFNKSKFDLEQSQIRTKNNKVMKSLDALMS